MICADFESADKMRRFQQNTTFFGFAVTGNKSLWSHADLEKIRKQYPYGSPNDTKISWYQKLIMIGHAGISD